MSKSKNLARILLIVLSLVAMLSIFMYLDVPVIDKAYATAIEDNINNSTTSTTEPTDSILDDIKNQEVDGEDKGMADWVANQRGVTSNQLETATQAMSPITNIIGYVTGGVLILVVTGVVLITALDLLYIAIPPVRNILYKAGTDGTGMNMGVGSMSGMGVGSMNGMGVNTNGGKKPTQWVSDEAVACAAMLGGSSQSRGGMNGMNGMGVGMYGMGINQQQQSQTPTMKSVIGTYFKKRLFFIILLALCVIILTSSALMQCGVNLAEWVLKIINMFNTKMSAN